MQFFSNLRSDPINTLNDWQNTRWPWGIMAATMILLVLVAHYVFQEWLHMAPCEQCVYIRYGNLVVALGGLVAMIDPKKIWTKICGYVIAIYGLIYTTVCSLKLIKIHDAVHSDDPAAMFGVQGCSTEPTYPFGLPLDHWAPDWFKPTGDCGYDTPMPPDGVDLSGVQQYLIDMYQQADGWYLIPQWQFMDMAKCCLLACIVTGIVLLAMLAAWLIVSGRKKTLAVA